MATSAVAAKVPVFQLDATGHALLPGSGPPRPGPEAPDAVVPSDQEPEAPVDATVAAMESPAATPDDENNGNRNDDGNGNGHGRGHGHGHG